MKKGTNLILLTGVIAAGIWWIRRQNVQRPITLYIPKFHRGEHITPIAGDGVVYAITDVYYNSGRWMYALARLDGSGESGHSAEIIDRDYVLAMPVP